MSDTVRVTLVFPHNLWEEVKETIPAGQRSRVIAEATERELQRRRRLESVGRLRVLHEELARKYGETPGSADDIRRMREERDDQLNGMR